MVALDHSEVALAGATTEKVVGDIAAMPFHDREFDLVVCSEVLEHLPVDTFESARSELARLASGWVIVSVPNTEDLYVSSITCPACSARSSPWRHMRSFAPSAMHGLIPGFDLESALVFGPRLARRRRWEMVVKREILGDDNWTQSAICPQCGFRADDRVTSSRQASDRRSFRSRLVGLTRPRKRKWIVAVYRAGERRSQGSQRANE